jgi:glycosyltransferase involved in cell wall biosynthesis
MARRMVRRSDLIYSVSSYNQQILEQLVRHKVACQILPMGIDTYYYENHSDPATLRNELGLPSGKIILYVGKLNEKKGVTYLLKAFHSIAQDQRSSVKRNDWHWNHKSPLPDSRARKPYGIIFRRRIW